MAGPAPTPTWETMNVPPGSRPRRSVAAAAQRLADALRTGAPGPPVRDLADAARSVGDAGGAIALSGSDAGTDAATAEMAWAYEVQRTFIAAAWPGEAVVGRKIGLTSPAVQAQLGVDQPDFGTLLASMEVDDGAVVAVDRFLQPRVEGEIAFRLGADLDAGAGEAALTLVEVRAAITGAAAAIEICDSRIAGWDIRLVDTVADDASAGGYVLGAPWVPLAEFEPREARMTMTVTGHEPIRGRGSACLGDPLEAVLWLARTCAHLGDPLRAGEVVLSGALAPMRDLAPGCRAEVAIEGLGSVSVSRAEKGGDGAWRK